MRRRKLLMVLAGLAVVMCAAGAFVLWPRPGHATRENFRRIRIGMSKDEVEAILGATKKQVAWATEFDSVPAAECLGTLSVDGRFRLGDVDYWLGELVCIDVEYNNEGRVSAAECIGQRPSDHRGIRELRWRAERQWRKWFP